MGQVVASELSHEVLRVSFFFIVITEVAFGFGRWREAVTENIPFGEASDFTCDFVDRFEVKRVGSACLAFTNRPPPILRPTMACCA
jgi:hypothetical protein